MSDAGYVLDEADDDVESRRLRMLCEIYDPPTQELLASRIDLAGAKVLEIGAGTGSIARWLGDQVGAQGSVLATDINLRFLANLDHPNVTVQEHNIVNEDIEDAPYDLVHCRFLLEHNHTEARDLIAKMIRALRPGGWLVVEEADHGTNRAAVPDHPLSQPYDDAMEQLQQVFEAAGTNLTIFGRQVPPLFHTSDLVNVGSSANFDINAADEPWPQMLRLALQSVMVAAETGAIPGLDQIDLQSVATALSDPTFHLGQFAVVRAWGQRPE
ncbi:MAG: class I SAM-dependent methyltransferase [Acidimicrobiales bacterium]